MIKKPHRKIILASTSPRRAALLKQLGLRFTIVPSRYEEDMRLKLKPKDLAKHLAFGKAQAVARRFKNAVVIAADTFLVFRGRLLGKPRSRREAKRMLEALSGKAHSVVTGFALMDTASGAAITEAVESRVYFRKLDPREIAAYVASGEPLDKAGAYGIQGLGGIFVKKIEGDYFNVVGLPIGVLVKRLREFGVRVL